MARGRVIDKLIHLDRDLAKCPIEARYLYKGTIIHADDGGRMEADPIFLKAVIFPFDADLSVDRVCEWRDTIVNAGLIIIYEVLGKLYLYHPNWDKWQPIRKDRKHPSDCPSPNDGKIIPADNQPTTSRQPADNQPQTVYNFTGITIPYRTIPYRTVQNPLSQPPEEAVGLVQLLTDLMIQNNPTAKLPKNLSGWMRDADRLLRLDKRPLAEAQAILRFSQSDNFWKSNILSMSKFREKYDQLKLRMEGRGGENKIVGSAKVVPGKYGED